MTDAINDYLAATLAAESGTLDMDHLYELLVGIYGESQPDLTNEIAMRFAHMPINAAEAPRVAALMTSLVLQQLSFQAHEEGVWSEEALAALLIAPPERSGWTTANTLSDEEEQALDAELEEQRLANA